MWGTLRVWITRAWQPYAHKQGWLLKCPPGHLLRSPGTKMEPSEFNSTMAQPLLCRQKRNLSLIQHSPTQHHPRREEASMIYTVSLSRGPHQLNNPLGDHEAIIGKLLEIKNKYRYTPLSPLQRAWSWWTWLCSQLHEDSRRFWVTKSLGGVSCVSHSPLKQQDLCPHQNIFIPWTSRARLGAAPKDPSLEGNHKNSKCEQPHHVGHGYPLNSKT
jgi:hypothetical protein